MSILTDSLKNSLNFLNLIFDTIPTGIMIVDSEARIQSFNNAINLIFYKSDDKIINQLCGNALGCAFEVEANLDCGCTDYCPSCPLRNGILDSITNFKIIENKLLKRNFYINNKTIVKYLKFSIKPITLNQEKLAILFFDDVTEFYELAEKRNELLGIAAHDIRNPLSIIKLYVDYIKGHCDSENEKISKSYMVIDESIKYMIELLDDILSYASFEKSEIKLQKMVFDYIDFVKSIVNLQQLIGSEKNIKLNFTCSLSNLKIQFDNNKLTQVLNNLISNAIKYSFENSSVEIKVSKITQEQKEYVLTEIIDNGPGIELSEQEKLFKPFSRTKVRPTGNESSTGLGLAIAKKIIDAHDGKIGVNSQPSKGSNFWFSIPIIS